MIKTENLTYEYIRRDGDGNVRDVKVAVDGVSIEVSRGEFIAILGANGSGKSTFARLLNALLTPGEGSVYIDGIDASDTSRLFDIRSRVGMVFQNPDNQIVGGTVEEDVAFGAENLCVPVKELRARVDESLKAVGLYESRKHSPTRLSGGQKQRVSIAGILAMKPRCIILDEATSMLDPRGRQEVMNTVIKLNREEGMTLIVITHHMDEAVRASHVYCMENGRVAFHGTPRQVFSQAERLKELKLDVPKVTELAFALRQRGLSIPDGIMTKEELVEALYRARNAR